MKSANRIGACQVEKVLSSFVSNMHQSDGQRTDCGRSEDVPSESETSGDIS